MQLRTIFCIGWTCLSLALGAQSFASRQQYVETFIRFSNEVNHGLRVMQDELEPLNQSLNLYFEKKGPLPIYRKKMIWNDYALFPVLPDTLLRELTLGIQNYGSADLYKAYDYALKMQKIYKKIEGHRLLLETLIPLSANGENTHEQIYELLHHIEVAYFDMYALEERMYWNLENEYRTQALVLPKSEAEWLISLGELIDQLKSNMRAVRAGDYSKDFQEGIDQYKRAEQKCRAAWQQYLQIQKEKPSLYEIMETLLSKIRNIMAKSQLLHARQDTLRSKGAYQAHSHCYNNELLPLYNRYDNGVVVLYKQIIKQKNINLLPAEELCSMFELLYPEIPAYASLQEKEQIPVEELIAAFEKRRADSLAREEAERNRQMAAYATNHLVLLLDVSSSMRDSTKIPLLKRAVLDLSRQLRREDLISLVSFSDSARVILNGISAMETKRIEKILDQLAIRSGSNVDRGMKEAFRQAERHYIPQGNNRIILSTDGNFIMSDQTKSEIQSYANKGYYVSVFYFGRTEDKKIRKNLSEISATGKGTYRYIRTDNIDKSLMEEVQSVKRK